MLASNLSANRWTRLARNGAIAVLCATCGVLAVMAVHAFTDQLITSMFVVPVFAAAWFGGLVPGALTIALQVAVLLLALFPTGTSSVESAPEAVRLAVTVGVCILGVFLVTAARHLEQRFRALVTVASEGIWTIDGDGRTTYVNPRMAEMLGYTPAELRGRRFSEFVRQDTTAIAEAGFERRRQGVSERDECELLRKDGASVWVHWAGTPLSDGSRFIGALAVVSDLSELKRQETLIRAQADALQRANRDKEDFLAMLSHELRNPIAPLVTAAKLMEVKGDGTCQRERAVILRQAEHLHRLVDDISDVSRFMRGKFQIQCGTLDVAQLVREASEVVSPLITREQHALHVDVPDGLFVQGDSIRLRQVVVNLLANAAKYTPTGGRIDVRVVGSAEGIALSVRDNGIGISPDFQPVLFEPFSQKREALSRAQGGLGLGLAIVRGIVQGHGGTVDAHSDGVGRGSEFIVRLPAVTSQPSFSTSDPGELPLTPGRGVASSQLQPTVSQVS